jgi:hypothetical protein
MEEISIEINILSNICLIIFCYCTCAAKEIMYGDSKIKILFMTSGCISLLHPLFVHFNPHKIAPFMTVNNILNKER